MKRRRLPFGNREGDSDQVDGIRHAQEEIGKALLMGSFGLRWAGASCAWLRRNIGAQAARAIVATRASRAGEKSFIKTYEKKYGYL
jgi:hypothetical protein